MTMVEELQLRRHTHRHSVDVEKKRKILFSLVMHRLVAVMVELRRHRAAVAAPQIQSLVIKIHDFLHRL